MHRKTIFRTAAVVIAVALALLAGEGAASLFLGRSLLRPGGRHVPPRIAMLDEERLRAAALTEGHYALHVDPLVGNRLKGRFSHRFLDGGFTTDDLGLRRRTGPPPRDGALRLAVVGDSVAFGFGLNDDETIASRLESFLADTMAPDAVPPVAFTVAAPGWSAENHVRFLLDHFDDLKPDIVLCLPIGNDLDDGYGVDESGHRAGTFAPARGAAASPSYHTEGVLRGLAVAEAAPTRKDLQALLPVAYVGVTPESRRRWDSLLGLLEDLHDRVRASGGRFELVLLNESLFERQLVNRLRTRPRKLVPLGLFDRARVEDVLPGDPHPNARCARAAAWRMARHLIEQSCIPGGGARSLPPEDERYAGRNFAIDGPGSDWFTPEVEAREAARMIGPAIDIPTGEGWNQIYSGVALDGAVGFDALVALRNEGAARVELSLDRLTGCAVLHPFSIAVTVNGADAGRIDVPAPPPGRGAGFEASLPIPAAVRANPFLDIGLRPTNWTVRADDGISRMVALRLRRIALAR